MENGPRQWLIHEITTPQDALPPCERGGLIGSELNLFHYDVDNIADPLLFFIVYTIGTVSIGIHGSVSVGVHSSLRLTLFVSAHPAQLGRKCVRSGSN